MDHVHPDRIFWSHNVDEALDDLRHWENQSPSAFRLAESRYEGLAHFDQIALTEQQVREHDLPTAPPKRHSHTKEWGDGEACQLEALPPDILADLFEGALQRLLDGSRLEEILAAENVERVRIIEQVDGAQAANR